MVQQRLWDKYEAVILLDAVVKVRSGELDRKQAIVDVSEKLRKRAQISGIEIDDVYRNVAGITFQMHSMESAYIGYTLVKPATKLFLDVVKTMKENRKEYDAILREAMDLTGNKKASEEEYLKWLSKKVSAAQLSELYIAYTQINEYFLERDVLKKPLFETTDKKVLTVIQKTIDENRMFRFRHKRQINKMSAAIRHYVKYVKERKNEDIEGYKKDIPEIKHDVEHEMSIHYEADKAKSEKKEESLTFIDQKKQDFSKWLLNSGMAAATVRIYISSVGFIGKLAQQCGFISANIFEITNVEILKDAINKLMSSSEFIEKNGARQNQYRAAWIKYIQFSGDPTFSSKAISSVLYDEKTMIKKDDPILHRRLKSMASVYDDVNGFETEWIREKIGLPIEIGELEEAMDDIPWITEVREGVYSFSKNARCRINFDKESFVKVLMMRYQNGMQFDSIDLENFRETYSDIIGEDIALSDKELVLCLRKCGILYKGRVFPAEGIVNADAKEKLINYIGSKFAEGKQVLYYKAIYSDLSDIFAYCFNLTDAMMLKPYLEYICDREEFFFTDEYITKQRNIRVDHSTEVEEYLLSVGKPMSYEEIYAGLSHISKDIIYSEIKSNTKIMLNEKEHYFHYGIFEFSSKDADKISTYISDNIDEDGYCIWSQVFAKIQKTMPLFIENNVYLSSIGIRNSVAKKLSGRFNFDGEVICSHGKAISMADIYRLYGENHTPFSDDDLYRFSKEVNGGGIYFDSLSLSSVRVSKTLFVSKDEITFDVETTDNALSTYLVSGYMLVRDIDSFLVFPNVGYEWNEYLLESYLMYYSKKYALLNNGRSLNNVAGAVVRKGSGYDDFADICADVLAKGGCILTKNKALDYLREENLLTRRSYSRIEDAITKAKQIRNRKE